MLSKIGPEFRLGIQAAAPLITSVIPNITGNYALVGWINPLDGFVVKISQDGQLISTFNLGSVSTYINLVNTANDSVVVVYASYSSGSYVLQHHFLNSTTMRGGSKYGVVTAQGFASMATTTFTDGNIITCWGASGSGYQTSCKVVSSSGSSVSGTVSLSTTGYVLDIVSLPNANVIAGWYDTNAKLCYGQKISSSGSKVGNQFQLGLLSTDSTLELIALPQYSVLTIYQGSYQGQNSICGELYNASTITPIPIEQTLQVRNISASNYVKAFIQPYNNDVIVGWGEYQSSTSYSYYVQELALSSTSGLSKVGNKLLLDIGPGAIKFPNILTYSDKSLLAVWTKKTGTSVYDIFGQRFEYKALTFLNNQFTVTEGQSITLGANNIQAQDPNDLTAIITYRINNNLVGSWSLITFTDQQIVNGEVIYTHDGSENPASFTITASTITTSVNVAANVSYVSVNDAPIVTKNSLTITRGQSVILTPNDVLVMDSDATDNNLVVQVSNIQNAKVYFLSDPDTAITSFTMQNVRDGNVGIVQDGSNNSPILELSVTDGSLTSQVSVMNVTYIPVSDTPSVNDAPVILNNNLKVRQGQTVLVTSANLQVIDPDTDPQDLLFTVSNVTAGHFELATEPDVAVTQFTQADVINKQLRFIHDNSEVTPAYSLKVSDGTSLSTASTVVMTYINRNDAPIIVNPIPSRSFEVNKTFSFFVDPTKVFRDPDDDSLSYDLTQVDEDLTISMQQTNETNLEIFGELATNGGHDLILSARDTGGLVANTSLTIFGVVNSPIVETPTPSSNLGAIIGGTVAAAGAVALVSGLMGYFWCGRSNDKSRKGHHFAAALCDRLKLKGLDSFDTPEGKKFVAFADTLKQALYNDSGLDIDQEDDVFKARVASIASVIKTNLSQDTNCLGKSIITVSDLQSLDIQKLAQAITTKLQDEIDTPMQVFV